MRDPKASSRNCPVLRANGQPKPVLKQGNNGHWLHFNTLDDADNGTVIDFMTDRGLSFADIRDRFAPPCEPQQHRSEPYRSWQDVRQDAVPLPAPQWLIGRGVSPETLQACRPRIRCQRQRILFAHRDRTRSLTGFEIAPPDGPKRFATGGTCTLFATRIAKSAASLRTLAVTECGPDALSLARIDQCPDDHACLSTAGAPSPSQCEQIRHAIDSLPNLHTLLLAQDGDDAGDRQAETIRKHLASHCRVRVQRRRPPDKLDWNDLVRA